MAKTISKMVADLKNKETESGLKVRLRCGACTFLTSKHPKLEAPCANIGKVVSSRGCKLFQPNYGHVRQSQPDVIAQIGKMVKDFPERVKHLIAYSLINSTEMERVTDIMLGETLQLGQPVMVNLSAPHSDYLNCYFKGYAMGVTKDKKALILAAKLFEEDKWVTATVLLNPDTLMTLSSWSKHRKQLIKSKRVNAPAKALQGLMPIIPKGEEEDYEVPTMAEAEQIVGSKKNTKVVNTTFKVEGKRGRRVVTI